MNFEFYNPTQLIFGAGSLSRLGEVASRHGKKALLVTGGGSVKRNGTFDRAAASLKAVGMAFAGCDGVEPNPRIATVRRGARIAREEGCDVIIALGGGSTMDASKVMAAAFYYDGDPWDMIYHGQPNPHIPTRALPIITVPTLAATGSGDEHGGGDFKRRDERKILCPDRMSVPDGRAGGPRTHSERAEGSDRLWRVRPDHPCDGRLLQRRGWHPHSGPVRRGRHPHGPGVGAQGRCRWA